MVYRYMPKGVCSYQIDLELDGDVIKAVAFTGGCNGNLQGVSRLVEGMTVENAVSRLQGIHCGSKATSCPDQLAQALKAALEMERKEQA